MNFDFIDLLWQLFNFFVLTAIVILIIILLRRYSGKGN
ncbi:MAG: hypothetical protein FD141_243 [Fusobacteria bacterium]|nr:MAG: hypothetical protein FD141_243 [Fusobacteriota bacterium]KAF0229093.1 MAG: hypothetical protein FD182_1349 [Fusobacteriota bacterium]